MIVNLSSEFTSKKSLNWIDIVFDGSLEVDQQNTLLDKDSMIVLNINDLENIEYSNGRYNNRIVYQTLGLISLLFIHCFIHFTRCMVPCDVLQ